MLSILNYTTKLENIEYNIVKHSEINIILLDCDENKTVVKSLIHLSFIFFYLSPWILKIKTTFVIFSTYFRKLNLRDRKIMKWVIKLMYFRI